MTVKLAFCLAKQPIEFLQNNFWPEITRNQEPEVSSWTKRQAQLHLAAQNRFVLEQVFAKIDANSCPNFYNFHLHTVNSDGQLQPEELMKQAVKIGLKGLAITDHHSINGYKAAIKWLAKWQSEHGDQGYPGPQLWTGVEINALLLKVEVHILGYAFNPDADSIQPYIQGHSMAGLDPEAYQAANVIKAIQQAGGLAILAHPMRYRQSVEELIPAAHSLKINGVETYYAYDNPHPWRSSPKQMQQVEALRDKYRLLGSCGTDTHGKDILGKL